MNFGYRETIDKQKDLVSVQRKVVSKSLVGVLKVFLYRFLTSIKMRREFMKNWDFQS